LDRTVGLRGETNLIFMQPASPGQKLLHSREEPFVSLQTSNPRPWAEAFNLTVTLPRFVHLHGALVFRSISRKLLLQFRVSLLILSLQLPPRDFATSAHPNFLPTLTNKRSS
jgi:hypothetical protein